MRCGIPGCRRAIRPRAQRWKPSSPHRNIMWRSWWWRRSNRRRRALSQQEATVSVEFLLTSFIVVASPGTGVLYTLAAGLSRGARASILAAFACTLGIIPHMLAAITGLAAVLYASAVAFEAIKIAGVAYLLYLAWATLREKGALRIETEMSPKSARQVIVAG